MKLKIILKNRVIDMLESKIERGFGVAEVTAFLTLLVNIYSLVHGPENKLGLGWNRKEILSLILLGLYQQFV